VFEKSLYAQRRYFVQEITGLDDVFGFLDEWPLEKRDLAYETLTRYCREAAGGRWPISAVRENFQRFLKRHGKLASVEMCHPTSSRTAARNWAVFDRPVASLISWPRTVADGPKMLGTSDKVSG
jgi:hypothetical protein